MWKYGDTDDYLIRTTDYSLPDHLHEHVELIQPTTLFARWDKMRTTLHFDKDSVVESTISTVLDGTTYKADVTGNAPAVDPSCNATVTLSCIAQLYNFVGYKPQVPTKNSIGITGYLEQFANLADLKSFNLEQRPEAANSTFEFISVKGRN